MTRRARSSYLQTQGGVGLNLQSGSVVINMDIPWNPAVLEQRIGRVHRLGQYRTVRVINFVSASSIEERILDLLKFKKSVFAGALDDAGENVVMIGESKLKQFMHSVETMTENLPKVDASMERQEQREAEQDEKETDIREQTVEKEETLTTRKEEQGLDYFNDLITSGAQFLMNLNKAISQPAQTPGKYPSTFIDRDEKTGKTYLKIPLPKPEVVQNIFSTLGELLSKVSNVKISMKKEE